MPMMPNNTMISNVDEGRMYVDRNGNAGNVADIIDDADQP
jgi:hypothetical protein